MDNDLPANNPPSPTPPPVPPVYTPPPQPHATPARREKKGAGWKIATVILALALVGLLALQVVGVVFAAAMGPAGSAGPRMKEFTVEDNAAPFKIAVIPVEGIIMGDNDPATRGMARSVEQKLKRAAQDDRVKAVILRVNSPGGEVLASDDIAKAIERFQQKYNKPVIASMSSLAASGGYYVSAPCRWIVAHDLTMTGSIGVIMQTYNVRGLMNKVGVRPMTYTSGKFKDMLSFSKEIENLSPQEKADLQEEELLMRKMIDDVYGRFKSVVASGRKWSNGKNSSNSDPGQPLSARWADYADGRILSGKEAYDLGLVDELGNFEVAVKRALKFAGLPKADLVIYQEPFSLLDVFGILGKADAKTVRVDVGLDLPKLKSGMYYLAPALR